MLDDNDICYPISIGTKHLATTTVRIIHYEKVIASMGIIFELI